LRVCVLSCVDKLDIEYRPYLISEVLGDDSQEGVVVTPEIMQNPEDIMF
jgi:hypothetical protein